MRRAARGVWALVAGIVLIGSSMTGGVGAAAERGRTTARPTHREADAERARCLALIVQVNADLTSFTARVHQTKKLALLEQPLESSGRLAFQRPERFSWRIDEPTPLRVIVDGDRVSIPGLATDEEVAAAIGPAALVRRLAAVFTGNIAALTDAFDVTATCREDAAVVTLSPLAADLAMTVSSLTLALGGPELFVRSIRMTNGVGDSLELRLQDVERNIPIPESTFSTSDGAP